MWDTQSRSLLNALGRSLALIEFDLSGKILKANSTFCETLGYSLPEIVGQHHSLFVAPSEARSEGYDAFWEKLRRGESIAAEFARIGKNGREIWVQASYDPVRNAAGKVYKIIKQATDITSQKASSLDSRAKLDALSRAQAIIEFTPDGTIVTANANFLDTLGYTLAEIQGQHHRMFVEPAFTRSPDYQAFWTRLARGEFVAAEFKRIGKGGREVWIQASYNPVLDTHGRVVKVVKFATDVTRRVQAVQVIADGLGRLAQNDLTHQIDVALDPAFERLRVDFNASLVQMQSALQQVADGVATIRTSSEEVSTAVGDLSRRTESQAASLEETAAALDEITATVKKTAEGSAHVQTVVATTKANAERTGGLVERAVQSMTAIEASSQQISQIIGVIDEIAFQTSLLALNAGVEAARAGEAGRGFAVVASEVRALAQRSAEAAKQIKALILASTAQVAGGVSLVGETGQALKSIMAQVHDVDGIVSGMAMSAHEQALALQEVNTAINHMDQVTQQNAAMVEQSTAAAQALSREAQGLSGLISEFRIGRDPSHSHPLQAAARPGLRPASRAVCRSEAAGKAAMPR